MFTLTGHAAAVRSVAYSPDGQYLASGSDDGTVRVWDLARRHGARVLVRERLSAEVVAFTPNSAVLLAGLSNGDIIAVDTERWATQWNQEAHSDGVKVLLPHPDGSRVLSTGWDRDVCVWTLKRPKRTRLLRLPDPPASAALSPDGNTLVLAMSRGNTIDLVDAGDGRTRATLAGGEGQVVSLAFAADGSFLAAGETRGRVRLWAADKWGQSPSHLERYGGPVYALAFTPDGRRLLTAGSDGAVRVWDVSSGRELDAYQWHRSWMTCLAIAPDGLTVATGGDDKVIAVWDIPD